MEIAISAGYFRTLKVSCYDTWNSTKYYMYIKIDETLYLIHNNTNYKFKYNLGTINVK